MYKENKEEFNHFFKSRSSDIVLLNLVNLHQNAKRYEARNTIKRGANFTYIGCKILDIFNKTLGSINKRFFSINKIFIT